MTRTDHLLLAYFALVGVVVLLLRPGEWLALGIVALGALSLVVSAGAAGRRVGRVAHDFWPIPMIIVGYEASAALTRAVAAPTLDARIAALNAQWFGGAVEGWRFALGRPTLLTDLASAAYGTFYIFPAVIAVLLYLADRRAFHEFAWAITLTFVLSWLSYALFPAAGPRDGSALSGSVVGGALTGFLRIVERNHFDAFPSGHTAVVLVAGWHGVRRFPRWAPIIIGVGAAIVFSTVYLSFHYIVDVVAGAMLAFAIVVAPYVSPLRPHLAHKVHRPSGEGAL